MQELLVCVLGYKILSQQEYCHQVHGDSGCANPQLSVPAGQGAGGLSSGDLSFPSQAFTQVPSCKANL